MPGPRIVDHSSGDVPPPTEIVDLKSYRGEDNRVPQRAENQRPIPTKIRNAGRRPIEHVSIRAESPAAVIRPVAIKIIEKLALVHRFIDQAAPCFPHDSRLRNTVPVVCEDHFDARGPAPFPRFLPCAGKESFCWNAYCAAGPTRAQRLANLVSVGHCAAIESPDNKACKLR